MHAISIMSIDRPIDRKRKRDRERERERERKGKRSEKNIRLYETLGFRSLPNHQTCNVASIFHVLSLSPRQKFIFSPLPCSVFRVFRLGQPNPLIMSANLCGTKRKTKLDALRRGEWREGEIFRFWKIIYLPLINT